MLDAKRLAAGEFSTNYEGVDTAGVGNQYVVLRQDYLIARVLSVRDLTQYFPVRYGKRPLQSLHSMDRKKKRRPD